jgi:hypothetical protein
LKRRIPAGRVAGEQVALAVNTRLTALFGKNSYVEKYVFPSLYLRTESVPPERFPDLARAAGEAALNVAGVAGYRAVPAGPGGLTPESAALFARSLFPGRSGDVVLAYQPNSGSATAKAWRSRPVLLSLTLCAAVYGGLPGPDFRLACSVHRPAATLAAASTSPAGGVDRRFPAGLKRGRRRGPFRRVLRPDPEEPGIASGTFGYVEFASLVDLDRPAVS